jgi:hypothetical protein
MAGDFLSQVLGSVREGRNAMGAASCGQCRTGRSAPARSRLPRRAPIIEKGAWDFRGGTGFPPARE